MEIEQRHLMLLKDFLDRKIDAKDIASEDKEIILKLCKARKTQLQNVLNKKTKKLEELKKKNNN